MDKMKKNFYGLQSSQGHMNNIGRKSTQALLDGDLARLGEAYGEHKIIACKQIYVIGNTQEDEYFCYVDATKELIPCKRIDVEVDFDSGPFVDSTDLLPAGSTVKHAAITTPTAFDGTSLSLKIGTPTDDDKFVAAGFDLTEVFNVATDPLVVTGNQAVELGIANGTFARVVDIIFPASHNPANDKLEPFFPDQHSNAPGQESNAPGRNA